VKTTDVLALLRAYESPNILFTEPDGSWPIVWERARGVHIWDAEDRKYLDLTAAFGVAAAGHSNPKVVAAGRRQMGRLLHAMGDVHPHSGKALLAQELSHITFERWTRGALSAKTIFCNSGFEAVEAALKTAVLATHRPGVIAFDGAYHGLGYGALNATHRELFRAPFRSQLAEFGTFVPFPTTSGQLVPVEQQIRRACADKPIGAILVEPIQGRGGINVPPAEFLPALRAICDEFGVLLILDEIYTGFGRTGAWFACEHSAVVPDLICVGKALTGGFPMSACVGKATVIDNAWPASCGEAIHTSTFLGHPVGCAMALAQIKEIEQRGLVQRSAEMGKYLLNQINNQIARRSGQPIQCQARGQGLMVGLELSKNGAPATTPALTAVKEMLRRGFILLPDGACGNVISLTPPLTIQKTQLRQTVNTLFDVLDHLPSDLR
jgi:4-aminobutyrate aminotransferase-like enzyme